MSSAAVSERITFLTWLSSSSPCRDFANSARTLFSYRVVASRFSSGVGRSARYSALSRVSFASAAMAALSAWLGPCPPADRPPPVMPCMAGDAPAFTPFITVPASPPRPPSFMAMPAEPSAMAAEPPVATHTPAAIAAPAAMVRPRFIALPNPASWARPGRLNGLPILHTFTHRSFTAFTYRTGRKIAATSRRRTPPCVFPSASTMPRRVMPMLVNRMPRLPNRATTVGPATHASIWTSALPTARRPASGLTASRSNARNRPIAARQATSMLSVCRLPHPNPQTIRFTSPATPFRNPSDRVPRELFPCCWSMSR
ncbi:hypothetical protein BLIC_b01295 [Bifidobacterium longum subsp. infantis]|uniref:Uncharacterized protein n=1 Tax=Bifidobacterium longum subsp. infantis TaxID=1682 RepID=A0ABP1X677_BIFLI|nr:hypothetical protein BLIC_a01293 [Bifidobacterium longum subsp. infantis]CEF00363.1 hypothetical protein BLIC_b01295 [Bifidobacterium longum subsp. infantis]CEF01478.1 hypothetical protein BLIC_c01299 [Bifidobacterium longum subsp. infantis]